MDVAKIRIAASVGAAVFGFIGTTALCVAGTLAFATQVGLMWASFIMAGITLLTGVVCAIIFLKPSTTTEEELDQFEHATADMLADLPFDTIASLVEKRPIAAASMALAAGYFVVRHPDEAIKGLQKLADELI